VLAPQNDTGRNALGLKIVAPIACEWTCAMPQPPDEPNDSRGKRGCRQRAGSGVLVAESGEIFRPKQRANVDV
jgi:hypothetical protein